MNIGLNRDILNGMSTEGGKPNLLRTQNANLNQRENFDYNPPVP